MIKVDISNVWGSVEFGDLMAMEKEVSAAHACLAEGSGLGREHTAQLVPLPGAEAVPGVENLRIPLNTPAQVPVGPLD